MSRPSASRLSERRAIVTPVDDTFTEPTDLLRTVLTGTAALLADLTEAEADQPTGCAGWNVPDLVQHQVFDLRRGLVALSTPADGPCTTDAVGYWRQWDQGPDDAASDRWRTRVVASAAGGLPPLVEAHAELSAAVLVSASRVAGVSTVGTQGLVLTADDLLDTLAVEATVHHLDLVRHLDRAGPEPIALARVRQVLTALLGRPLPVRWDDTTAVRRCTGREGLDRADREELGGHASALPLLA